MAPLTLQYSTKNLYEIYIYTYNIKLSIDGLSNSNAAMLGESFTLFLEGPGKYLLFILIPNNCSEPISFLEYEVHCGLLWKNKISSWKF